MSIQHSPGNRLLNYNSTHNITIMLVFVLLKMKKRLLRAFLFNLLSDFCLEVNFGRHLTECQVYRSIHREPVYLIAICIVLKLIKIQ